MYFLKKLKKQKKPVRLTNNYIEEIIEIPKYKSEKEKIENQLNYIIEKFPDMCKLILELRNRVKILEDKDYFYI